MWCLLVSLPRAVSGKWCGRKPYGLQSRKHVRRGRAKPSISRSFVVREQKCEAMVKKEYEPREDLLIFILNGDIDTFLFIDENDPGMEEKLMITEQ